MDSDQISFKKESPKLFKAKNICSFPSPYLSPKFHIKSISNNSQLPKLFKDQTKKSQNQQVRSEPLLGFQHPEKIACKTIKQQVSMNKLYDLSHSPYNQIIFNNLTPIPHIKVHNFISKKIITAKSLNFDKNTQKPRSKKKYLSLQLPNYLLDTKEPYFLTNKKVIGNLKSSNSNNFRIHRNKLKPSTTFTSPIMKKDIMKRSDIFDQSSHKSEFHDSEIGDLHLLANSNINTDPTDCISTSNKKYKYNRSNNPINGLLEKKLTEPDEILTLNDFIDVHVVNPLTLNDIEEVDEMASQRESGLTSPKHIIEDRLNDKEIIIIDPNKLIVAESEISNKIQAALDNEDNNYNNKNKIKVENEELDKKVIANFHQDENHMVSNNIEIQQLEHPIRRRIFLPSIVKKSKFYEEHRLAINSCQEVDMLIRSNSPSSFRIDELSRSDQALI